MDPLPVLVQVLRLYSLPLICNTGNILGGGTWGVDEKAVQGDELVEKKGGLSEGRYGGPIIVR